MDAADGAHLPRTGARQRVATRGRLGLRRHPRPAAGRDPRLRAWHGVAPDSTKWIWRCHIDLTDANPQVFEFFRPFVEQYDASVWTMPQFVPDSLQMDRVVIAPPCIDPLSVKNLDLPHPFVERDRQAVRRAARRSADGAGEPVRPVEGPDRRHRGVPHREGRVPERCSSCSPVRWPPTTPRASTTGSSPTRRAPATPTCTCCRTSSRSATCRSTRSNVSPTSSCRSRCARASASPSARDSGRAGRSSAGAAAGSRCRSRTASTATSSTTWRPRRSARADLLRNPARADEMGDRRARVRPQELPVDARARRLAAPLQRAAVTGAAR